MINCKWHQHVHEACVLYETYDVLNVLHNTGDRVDGHQRRGWRFAKTNSLLVRKI
jgi:hypothetical protein